jgi:hypothetical protein
MGRDALKGEIDENIEEVRDGIDEPEKNDGEQRRPKKARTSKEENHSGTVSEGYERVWGEVDGPFWGNDKDKDCLVAYMNCSDGDSENDETTPTPFHLPVLGAPDPENEEEADQRDHHADRLEGVRDPKCPKGSSCGPDGTYAEDREDGCESCGVGRR